MASNRVETSWLAATLDAINLAQSASDTQRQFADLEEAKAAFTELNTSLQASATAASALRSTGWIGRDLPPDVSHRLDEVITKPHSRLLTGVPRELTRFNDDVRRALINHWRNYASSQIGDVEGLLSLTDTLAEVDGVADLVERLRTALGQLARAQDNLPTADSLSLLTAVQQVLVDLEASLQPESVRAFLAGVARGGAEVTSLTKEVALWLTEHDALHSFKIVAGPPMGTSDG